MKQQKEMGVQIPQSTNILFPEVKGVAEAENNEGWPNTCYGILFHVYKHTQEGG